MLVASLDSYDTIKPMKRKRSRVLNLDLISKYHEYRKMGLSYEEVRKFINKDNRQFQRWNLYIKRGILKTLEGVDN